MGRASWIAPLLAVLVNMAAANMGRAVGSRSTILVGACIAGVLILAGMVLAVGGLVTSLRSGRYGRTMEATIGLVLNGLLIALAVYIFFFPVGPLLAALQRQGPGWYHNQAYGFAIRFPEDWSVAETPMGNDSVLVEARSPSPTDGSYRQMTVAACRVSADWTADELLARDMPANLLAQIGIEQGSVPLNSQYAYPARWIKYRAKAGDAEVDVLAFCLTAGPRGYVVSCIAPRGQMDASQRFFEEIVATLTLNE